MPPRHLVLIVLAVTLAGCGIATSEVSTRSVDELATGVEAVILNRTATELEMTFSTEGQGHSSEGSGLLPACNVTRTLLSAMSGDSWRLSVSTTGPDGPVVVIELDTATRPDLSLPLGRARRVEVTIDDASAAITQNVLIDPELADDNLGNEQIPNCG